MTTDIETLFVIALVLIVVAFSFFIIGGIYFTKGNKEKTTKKKKEELITYINSLPSKASENIYKYVEQIDTRMLRHINQMKLEGITKLDYVSSHAWGTDKDFRLTSDEHLKLIFDLIKYNVDEIGYILTMFSPENSCDSSFYLELKDRPDFVK